MKTSEGENNFKEIDWNRNNSKKTNTQRTETTKIETFKQIKFLVHKPPPKKMKSQLLLNLVWLAAIWANSLVLMILLQKARISNLMTIRN